MGTSNIKRISGMQHFNLHRKSLKGFRARYWNIRNSNNMIRNIQTELNQQRKLVKELQLENKALKAMLDTLKEDNHQWKMYWGGFGHETKGPIVTLMAAVKLLKRKLKDNLDDQSKEYIKSIIENGNMALNNIDGVLMLAIKTDKENNINLEKVDLSILAKLSEKILRDNNPNRNIEIVIENNLFAYCNKQLIGMLIHNLLSNAWKYSSKKEKAKISFGYDDCKKAFFVRDNGIGFDISQAKDIFKSFTRFHSEDEFKGSGIGMATVKKIIDLHHGKIWAEGGIGKGVTFYFSMPDLSLLKKQ